MVVDRVEDCIAYKELKLISLSISSLQKLPYDCLFSLVKRNMLYGKRKQPKP